MSPLGIYVAAVVTALATYFWRAFGVAVGGRLDPQGRAFEWFSCIAYAVLAALVVRLVVFPAGGLTELSLIVRLSAFALAIGVFFLARRNVFLGCGAGTGAVALAAWLA